MLESRDLAECAWVVFFLSYQDLQEKRVEKKESHVLQLGGCSVWCPGLNGVSPEDLLES